MEAGGEGLPRGWWNLSGRARLLVLSFLSAATPCAMGRGFLLGVGPRALGSSPLSRSTTSEHST